MHAILHAHGHKAAWTSSLLAASLYYCGFKNMTIANPGSSRRQDMIGLEGHGKVIGEVFNNIETVVCEGETDK
jgi:hypothetical protein